MTEYDPNRWNLWPAAQPPTGVLMRLEIFPKEGYMQERIKILTKNAYEKRIMTCGRWVGWWELTDGEKVDPRRIEHLRYKPWEFEE